MVVADAWQRRAVGRADGSLKPELVRRGATAVDATILATNRGMIDFGAATRIPSRTERGRVSLQARGKGVRQFIGDAAHPSGHGSSSLRHVSSLCNGLPAFVAFGRHVDSLLRDAFLVIKSEGDGRFGHSVVMMRRLRLPS